MTRLTVVLATLCAAATTAHADDGAWHGFQSLGISDAQLASFEPAVVSGLRAGGLLDEVVVDASARRCGSDLACYCSSLRARGLRFGVYGSIGRIADVWTIELTLVDSHACTVEGAAYASEQLANRDVAARITTLARRVSTPPATIAATAVGHESAIDATPAIVTTFTRSQLRALQIRTLEDLLPLVPGFDIVDANWGTTVLNEGLQNTLLFLTDGIPLINGQNNFRWLDRDYRTSLAHLARIEIVQSPGAVLWGRNAFLGVINLISEKPTRRESSVDAGITVGSLDTEEAWGHASQNRGSYGFTASVDVGRRVGPSTHVVDSPQTTLGVSPTQLGNGGDADPEPDTWFEIMMRVAVGKHVELLFQNQTSDINFEISPRGSLLDAGQGGYWRKTHRLYAVIATEPLREYDDEHLTLSAQLSRYEYYSWENYAIQPAWPDGPVPAPGGRDYRLGLRSLQGNDLPRVASELELRLRHDYKGSVTNHLTGGIGVLDLHIPDSLATLVGITETPAMPTVSYTAKTSYTLSTYALEELVPARGVGLSAGLRAQADGIEHLDGSRQWQTSISAQAGVVFERGPFASKLVYAQGFRPPGADSLYSTVGTLGNPDLVPERSQDLALELSIKPRPELTLRAGGNLTEISQLIVLVPIPPPSTFAYTPENKGTIEVTGAFVTAQLALGGSLDAFVNYHIASLDESDPLTPPGSGIPLARHTGALGAVWRPAPDLSLFARGSFSSPRTVQVLTAADPDAVYRTPWTIRSAIGASLANAVGPLTLDVSIDNPLLREHDSPYQLDGAISGLVERRQGTEVFGTLRYEH